MPFERLVVKPHRGVSIRGAQLTSWSIDLARSMLFGPLTIVPVLIALLWLEFSGH